MIDFFKKLFSQKPEEIEVKKKDLKSFAARKHDELVEIVLSRLQNDKAYFDSLIENAKEKRDTLAKAKLKNDKIQKRAIQLMEGNRRTYLKRIDRFLDKHKFPDATKEEDIQSLKEFIQGFEEDIDSLTKSTQRSYAVLQEFLANESRDLAQAIRGARDQLRKTIQYLQESGYNDSIKTLQIFEQIKSLNERKRQIKDDELNITKDIEQIGMSLKTLQKDKKELKTSNEFQEYQALKHRIEEASKDIDKQKAMFVEPFHVLEHALKKYKRMSLEQNLISKYLDDASKAALNDKSASIISVLDKLRDSVEKGKIDIKDKKKEKTLQAISRVSKGYLEDFRTVVANLQATINESQQKLEHNSSREELEEVNSKIKKFEEQLKEHKEALQGLKKLQASTNMSKLYDDAASTAGKAHNLKIIIK